MFLSLDMRTVREVISGDDVPETKTSSLRQGFAVGETTLGLLSPCSRLLELLETPEDIPFLSYLIQREILYRILRTPQAERLRAIATSGDLSQRTTRAIAWLRANFANPLHIQDLPSTPRIRISPPPHHFPSLTPLTPLPYPN